MPPFNLRTKLLLGVLPILALVLGLLLYGFQAEYARQREEVLASLTQTAQTIAVLVDSSFDEALGFAQTLADDPVVQTLDSRALDPYFDRLARYRPELNYLGVFDAGGNEMGAAARRPGEPTQRINVADRRYFQQVMATGAPVLSEVLIGRVLQRPSAGAAAPLPAQAGRPAGVVVVSPSFDVLARTVASVGLRPDQAIFLVDRTGRVAFHTARPELSWEARDISAWPEVRAALAGQIVRTSDFRSPLLGDVRATVFVSIPKHGWVVGVTWPTARAFGPLEQANRLQLLVFGAIALGSVVGMVVVAGRLTAPLLQLADLARVLGRGELGRRADIRTGDELQVLGETLNTMAARLEGTIGQLRETIAELTTPVLTLREGLFLLPLIGTVDATRARQMTEELLRAIRANRARVVVMDITGVPVVDSAVANHLVQTVQAARLMGAAVIVTGLSPEIAQTLATLGLDLRALNTVGDLQSGMEEADRMLGYRVVKTERDGRSEEKVPPDD